MIVEDSSALWPVSVQAASIKESVALLEEEVVSNQLVPVCVTHGAERVESTGKFTVKGVASLDYLLLDGISLLSGDAGAQWELGEVAADSDACGLNHGGIGSVERWAAKLRVIHVADVLGTLGMAVIIQDNLVHEGSEGGVRVVGAGIDANA